MSERPPKILPPKVRDPLRLGQVRVRLVEDQRILTAVILSVVNSMLLLLLAELNYRFLMVHGLPWISYSGYPNGAGLVSYYSIPLMPFNVPEVFLLLTGVAIAIVLSAMWLFTRGVRGRKRMLALLVLCSAISFGFSCWSLRWEKVHLEDAEWSLRFQESEMEAGDQSDWYQFNVQRLRSALDAYEKDRGR